MSKFIRRSRWRWHFRCVEQRDTHNTPTHKRTISARLILARNPSRDAHRAARTHAHVDATRARAFAGCLSHSVLSAFRLWLAQQRGISHKNDSKLPTGRCTLFGCEYVKSHTHTHSQQTRSRISTPKSLAALSRDARFVYFPSDLSKHTRVRGDLCGGTLCVCAPDGLARASFSGAPARETLG